MKIPVKVLRAAWIAGHRARKKFFGIPDVPGDADVAWYYRFDVQVREIRAAAEIILAWAGVKVARSMVRACKRVREIRRKRCP